MLRQLNLHRQYVSHWPNGNVEARIAAMSSEMMDLMFELMLMQMMNSNQDGDRCQCSKNVDCPVKRGSKKCNTVAKDKKKRKKRKHKKHCRKKLKTSSEELLNVVYVMKCVKGRRRTPEIECPKGCVPACDKDPGLICRKLSEERVAASEPGFCSKCGQRLPGSRPIQATRTIQTEPVPQLRRGFLIPDDDSVSTTHSKGLDFMRDANFLEDFKRFMENTLTLRNSECRTIDAGTDCVDMEKGDKQKQCVVRIKCCDCQEKTKSRPREGQFVVRRRSSECSSIEDASRKPLAVCRPHRLPKDSSYARNPVIVPEQCHQPSLVPANPAAPCFDRMNFAPAHDAMRDDPIKRFCLLGQNDFMPYGHYRQPCKPFCDCGLAKEPEPTPSPAKPVPPPEPVTRRQTEPLERPVYNDPREDQRPSQSSKQGIEFFYGTMRSSDLKRR